MPVNSKAPKTASGTSIRFLFLFNTGSGDLFGDDVSRKVPIRRSNGDVRALTYCDLLYLTRENFLGVTHLYPDFAEAFSLKLEMTFNLGMKEVRITN